MKTLTTMTTGRTRVDLAVRAFSVEITATTVIPVAVDRVWAVLADTEAYPQWNPFIRSLTGDLRAGARLRAVLQPADRPQTMRPRVVEATTGRGFTWLGHVVVPGILDGRHRFTVDPAADGTTRLIQHERLSGLLVPFFRRMLTADTPRAFAAMNDALAVRATAVQPDVT
jgi:hypothetical protein